MSVTPSLTLTAFTDPMMGLSYESEPAIRKLETHYPERINFRHVMAGLVRNVYDFVDASDLALGKQVAIDRYLLRLAKIYEAEESISGMPINMSKLKLFSPDHTSSIPLNLAYKAAQLSDPSRAAQFLYNLRYATIVECKPTTRMSEILAVVARTGMDIDAFQGAYDSGHAHAAMEDDFAFRRSLNITRLPTYLFDYAGRQRLVAGVLGYADFARVIADISDGALQPHRPKATLRSVQRLIDAHPLISPIEIREAFGLQSVDEVRALLAPLLEDGLVGVVDVPRGWFVEKCIPCR